MFECAPRLCRSIALGAVFLGACSKLKDNEEPVDPSEDAAADSADAVFRGGADVDNEPVPSRDSSPDFADASTPDSSDSPFDRGGVEDVSQDARSTRDAADGVNDPDAGANDIEDGANDLEDGGSDAHDDSREGGGPSDGDARMDGRSDSDTDDAEDCVADCPLLGQFRCADSGDAGIARQVQVCSLARGCLQWLDTATCKADEVCCNGACEPLVCDDGTCLASPRGATGTCGAAFDVYVDASAPTTGNCSMASPCRTVTAGIATALANPAGRRRILVAPGKYDAGLGERFPLDLRAGVSIVGAGNNTVIEGSGLVSHILWGGDVIDDFFATVMMGDVDSNLPDVLSNVAVRPDPLASGHQILGIACDRGNAHDDQVPVTPGATLSRLDLGPGFDFAVLVTNSTIPSDSGCYLRMTGSRVHDSKGGVWLTGCSNSGPPTLSVGAEIGGLSSGSGNEFRNIRSNLNGFGVHARAGARRLLIASNTFVDADTGVLLDQGAAGVPTSSVTLVANRFENLDNFGVNVQGSVVIDEFRQNAFSNVSGASNPNVYWPAPGVVFDSDLRMKVKARNNQFIGNDIGVLIHNSDSTAPASGNLDFGTAVDPGKNTFCCNSGAVQSQIMGGDVVIDILTSSRPSLTFEGDLWDHVPPTKTPDNSNRVNGTEIAVVKIGPVVDVQTSVRSDSVCPAGRVP